MVAYIGLTAVVVIDGFIHVLANPSTFSDWTEAVANAHSSLLAIVGASLLVSPALALGLSGFETGVVVMPLVRATRTTHRPPPRDGFANARKLLTTAALIMSVLLVGSAFVTTFLIPAAERHGPYPASRPERRRHPQR